MNLQFDIITPIQGLLQQGRLWINKDGLIETKMVFPHDSPWLFVNPDKERDCGLWSKIMFNYYKIIPKGCMKCWKIATKPRTLDEAFKMLAFQEKLGLPSKTGMETRDYSGNLGGWASIWHCSLSYGLEEAREQYALVKKKMQDEFGELPLVLKRGCTAMEKVMGPSDKWKTTEDWEIKERQIEAAFAPWPVFTPPKYLEPYIKRRWIEYAAAHGDLTYLKYCSNPINPSLVFYHRGEGLDI